MQRQKWSRTAGCTVARDPPSWYILPEPLLLSFQCAFLRHLHISNVLRICLIRTWPYSLLKQNRRDRLIISLSILWQTYIFLIKHFPNQSNPWRCKSSFIRSFPKGVREKMPYKEKRQREWGSVFKELLKDTLILRLNYRYFKGTKFYFRCNPFLCFWSCISVFSLFDHCHKCPYFSFWCLS